MRGAFLLPVTAVLYIVLPEADKSFSQIMKIQKDFRYNLS